MIENILEILIYFIISLKLYTDWLFKIRIWIASLSSLPLADPENSNNRILQTTVGKKVSDCILLMKCEEWLGFASLLKFGVCLALKGFKTEWNDFY